MLYGGLLCVTFYFSVRRLDWTKSIITYSVLISYCFALHPYEKHELIKPEWVIENNSYIRKYSHLRKYPLPIRN